MQSGGAGSVFQLRVQSPGPGGEHVLTQQVRAGTESCISNKLPGDGKAAGLQPQGPEAWRIPGKPRRKEGLEVEI